MKRKLLFFFFLITIAFCCKGQEPPAVDTLKHFTILFKGEPMPYDSGVAVDYIQYQFIARQDIFSALQGRLGNALKPVPKIVYVDKIVRKKGDGKKSTWFLGGAGAGIGLTLLGIILL